MNNISYFLFLRYKTHSNLLDSNILKLKYVPFASIFFADYIDKESF